MVLINVTFIKTNFYDSVYCYKIIRTRLRVWDLFGKNGEPADEAFISFNAMSLIDFGRWPGGRLICVFIVFSRGGYSSITNVFQRVCTYAPNIPLKFKKNYSIHKTRLYLQCVFILTKYGLQLQ